MFLLPVGASRVFTSSKPPSRGAGSNRSGRFESVSIDPDLDAAAPACGDATGDQADCAQPTAVRTTVAVDHARRVIARNESPDIRFDRSVNPYRGCEHGCIYCFARPSHAWLGLSPGLDFETRIFAKTEVAARLREELGARGYVAEPLALGANTDPYQPVERRMRLTRSILELLESCNHPVMIVTKSDLVLRDLDLLVAMARRNLVGVSISIATLDADLARRMDPRAPVPARRLATVAELARAGVPVSVLTSPVIPGLNDHELESLLESAAGAGAGTAGYALLRLPLELEDLFDEWLREHYPLRRDKVFSHLRGAHRGKAYRSDFATRLRGEGAYAALVLARFVAARRRVGMAARPAPLDAAHFRPPARESAQLSLFRL